MDWTEFLPADFDRSKHRRGHKPPAQSGLFTPATQPTRLGAPVRNDPDQLGMFGPAEGDSECTEHQ